MLLNVSEPIKGFVNLLVKLSMMLLKISTEMQEDLIFRENKKMMPLQMTFVRTTIMMKTRTRKHITVEHPFNLYNLLYLMNYLMKELDL